MTQLATVPVEVRTWPGSPEMVRQHRALRSEICELRGMIDSCRATQRTDGYRRMLAVLVSRLRERLSVHFVLEATGPLRVPALVGDPAAGGLADVTAEHDGLLAEAATLAAELRLPNAAPDVVARTLRWLESLRRHEQAESDLLAQP